MCLGSHMGLFISFSTGRGLHGLGRTQALGLRRCLCACAALRVLPVSSLWFMNSATRVCSGRACVCVRTHSGMDSAARQLPGLPLKVLLHSAQVSDSRAGRVRVTPGGGEGRAAVMFRSARAWHGWHTNRVLTALKPSQAQGLRDTRWQPARCTCESGFASLLT